MYKSLSFWLSSLCALTLFGSEAEPVIGDQQEVIAPPEEQSVPQQQEIVSQEMFCEETAAYPMRAALRYTSPHGIGYRAGYSTIEGFFSSFHGAWVPFLDLRAHFFDNGRFASNAGAGLRYLSTSRVWGANLYYDYRNNPHKSFNQVGFGLETLGEIWDVRLNGYVPVSNTHGPRRHVHFDKFKDHFMILKSKRDFSLSGGNLEVGAHVDNLKSAPFYFAAGPYYLTGKGASVWGGEFRAVVDLFHRHLRIEGNTSYDSFFKWIGQGQISLNYFFGCRKKLKRDDNCCALQKTLSMRAVQRVDREEIIPVGTQHQHAKAIDPATGKPFFFVFVNNTSNSLGTFESPYPSLALAQTHSAPGNVIYVFPGDGTSKNMDQGITLQNSQLFLGASIPHAIKTSWGTVVIPPLASKLPIITNTNAAPVVTVSSNNLISGFYVQTDNGNGVLGSNISNFTAEQNTFVGLPPSDGIFLTDVAGTVSLNGNSYTLGGMNATSIVHLQQSSANCSVNSINETYYANSGSNSINGILIELNNTSSLGTLNVQGGNFFNTASSGNGIQVVMNGSGSVDTISVSDTTLNACQNGLEVDLNGTGSVANLTVYNSNISNSRSANAIATDLGNTGSLANFTVSNSILNNNSGSGITAFLSGAGSITNLSVSDCSLDNNGTGILTNAISSGSIDDFSVSSSSLSLNNSGNGGIFATIAGSSSMTNFTVDDSVLNNNTNAGNGFGIQLNSSSSGLIQNVAISNSMLNNTGTGIQATIADVGSITNLSVSKCSISNVNAGAFGVFAWLQTGSHGSIANFTVSDSQVTDYTNGYSCLALLDTTSSGSIGNVSIIRSDLSNNTNGGSFQVAIQGLGTISNITVADSLLNNGVNSLYVNVNLPSTSTIDNLNVVNSSFNNNSGFGLSVNMNNTGTLTNFNVSNCVINNNNWGLYANSTGAGVISNLNVSNTTINTASNQAGFNVIVGTTPMTSLTVGNCSLNGNLQNGLRTTGGSISSLTVTQSSFANSGGNGILLGSGPINALNISNNSFTTNLQNGLDIEIIGGVQQGTIQNNIFTRNGNFGLNLPADSNCVYAVRNNTFAGTQSPSLGFGAFISNSGTLCLDFFKNNATPVTFGGGDDPYWLDNNVGTFNLTSESTAANNVGQITKSGSFGTCTQ